MREGEIFGLHWNSLDLTAGTVSVRQSLSEVSGKLELGEPKSKAGRRLIGLPQHADRGLGRPPQAADGGGLWRCRLRVLQPERRPTSAEPFPRGKLQAAAGQGRLAAQGFTICGTPTRRCACWRARIPRSSKSGLATPRWSLRSTPVQHVLPSVPTATRRASWTRLSRRPGEKREWLSNGCQSGLTASGKCARIAVYSEGKRMASGDTGNVVPGNRLRVRVPCPPLDGLEAPVMV